MLTLVFILVLVVFLIANSKDDYGELDGLVTFTGVVVIVLLIGLLVVGSGLINGRTYQKKIDILTEENNRIETDIAELVESYMEHENIIFDAAKSDSAITLVNLYPDLKSSELVQSEIEIHNKNVEEIKKYKLDQASISNYKWLLYFGKQRYKNEKIINISISFRIMFWTVWL